MHSSMSRGAASSRAVAILVVVLLAAGQVAPAAAIRQLLQGASGVSRRPMPPLDSLQGMWDGKRTTGAYLSWDEDDKIFDGGCIRNDERLIHAAFDKGGYKIDYEGGTLEYPATMQILTTFGRFPGLNT
jgi:hypothetical protein